MPTEVVAKDREQKTAKFFLRVEFVAVDLLYGLVQSLVDHVPDCVFVEVPGTQSIGI
jgi:hypothetical protein